ncbi:HTH-type transcriptional activator IlvY [Paraneptunicella aestuarii]|uniref:HTH-type transcriptional activator IlvY n=1 Tax=Paraneptunicella aestuarii TaxID=2831148 RepID=UPI001E5AA40C|nr:HTH-type transcriptional activator IlvY [Paraneptunicella aestuarii]UAA39219.1 HTH-type transcriptional activator IlvY [Paraneptunicella aestuarii]
MDIRTLSLFQHLAHSLHFSRTANAMYVSPSTLSRAIQRLEEECGADLFIRNNRSVKLTAIGKQVLDFCDEFLMAWQELKQDIDQHNEALRGELTIFCSVTASISHLPSLLDGFRFQYPQVEIKLFTGDPGESEQWVLGQKSDLAFAIHTPHFPKELTFYELDRIPLVLATPSSMGIHSIKDISWKDTPMVLPESGPSKRIVQNWLQEHDIKPNIYANVGGNEAIASMVALGCGIGFIPKIVLQHSVISNKINMLEVPDIEPYRLGLTCLVKRAEEPAINAFLHQLPGNKEVYP